MNIWWKYFQSQQETVFEMQHACFLFHKKPNLDEYWTDFEDSSPRYCPVPEPKVKLFWQLYCCNSPKLCWQVRDWCFTISVLRQWVIPVFLSLLFFKFENFSALFADARAAHSMRRCHLSHSLRCRCVFLFFLFCTCFASGWIFSLERAQTVHHGSHFGRADELQLLCGRPQCVDTEQDFKGWDEQFRAHTKRGGNLESN